MPRTCERRPGIPQQVGWTNRKASLRPPRLQDAAATCDGKGRVMRLRGAQSRGVPIVVVIAVVIILAAVVYFFFLR